MFNFKVTPDDGDSFEVTAGSRDIVTWEKTGRGKSFGALSEPKGMQMVDMYKLAHIAARRTGLFGGDLAEFERTCELEIVGEDEEPDPTQPAA